MITYSHRKLHIHVQDNLYIQLRLGRVDVLGLLRWGQDTHRLGMVALISGCGGLY